MLKFLTTTYHIAIELLHYAHMRMRLDWRQCALLLQ
jgi:uncharacterized protein involved in cysteine biosynthesis